MKLQTYVKKNWNKLPKSYFNEDAIVIVKKLHDDDEGWGNHSYSGIGIDATGTVRYGSSSGCSCHGTCGISGPVTDPDKALENLFFVAINFDDLQVTFQDYE